MRASPTTDPAVRELQDEARGTAGRRLGERWRALETVDEGQEALVFQHFVGGAWKTVVAIRADGTLRAVP